MRPGFSLFKSTLLVIVILFTVVLFSTAQTGTAKPVDNSFTVEYYYKVKWGYASEFISLFKKNHYPILKKEMEMGRILDLKIETPVYHGTEDGRWDYRVTITWKSPSTTFDGFDEESLKKQLFPDQVTFNKEEQRRFELLEAHWDLPVKTVSPDK